MARIVGKPACKRQVCAVGRVSKPQGEYAVVVPAIVAAGVGCISVQKRAITHNKQHAAHRGLTVAAGGGDAPPGIIYAAAQAPGRVVRDGAAA